MAILDAEKLARKQKKKIERAKQAQEITKSGEAKAKADAKKNKEKDLIGAKDAKKLSGNENKKKTTNNATGKAQQFSYVANKPASFSAKAISSEAEKKPMSATQYGKTQLSNQIYDKYRTIEKYYNDPTGNSLEKGLFNRLRSAGGETVENIARIIDDNISDNPEERMFNSKFADFLNTNAKNVVAKNTAGQIGDLADQQIMQAKENTGNFGDFLIDTADAGANMASQAILARVLLPGAPTPVANKVFSGVQGVSAGAQKYVDTREAGGSKAEAFHRGIGSGAIAAITEGLTGIGKTGVSKIPGVDRVVTHLDEFATKNWLTNVLSTGLGEGGEEGLEYAFEYASDVIADLIYKGEIETDFDVAELFQNVASGFVLGAGFGGVGGTANAYQNYTPKAETDVTTEAPVTPAEPPVIETENVTPEVQNEQEGAFASAGEKVEAKKENDVEKAPEETLKNLREQFDKGEISKEEYLAKNYENLSKYFEERKNANAQVNSTNDVVNSVNDVIEPANAQPRAQGDGGFGENTVGAAQSNPASYAHLQNEHGVFEPGEQPLARDPNVPLKDAQGNRVSQSVRTIMEAKVTPDELIPAFEKEVAAGTFQNKGTTNKEAVEKAAQRIANKSFKDAVSDFETLYSDDILLSKDDLVFGELLFSMAAQNGEADTAMKIASLLSSNNSRTGDAMQAQRILKRLSPEGRLYHAQRITDKFNKDKRQKNEIKLSEETVKKVLNAKTDEEIEAANDAVAEDIAKQIDRGFFNDLAGMWNAWRYLSMLGNPKTHIRNIFGNLAFLPVRKIKNVIKAGIESGAYKAGWIDEKTASVKLASKENREFAKESFEKNKKALLSGGNYRFESEIDSKIEPFRFTGKETSIKKFWNAVLTPARKGAEFNSNALEAEDVWFLESAYIDSLTQYLTANKIDAQNITPKQKTKAENYAAQEAKKATYRDDSAIANALEKLSNTEISFKGIKIKLRPFVDAVVPFRKTPINILARAVEYSPVGLATTLALDGRAVKNGDITANEMIDHVSSGLTGSGIYALGIALALKGVLTGGEDEDKNEKEFAKLQGEQPYALKIGDGSYTLDWLAPTAIPLFLGAETVRVLKKEYGEDEKWDDVVWEILVNLDKIANPMLELSMLQNLDSFLGSNYSKDGNALSGLAQDLIASYVLQAVPTLSSQIAQTKDGTRRNAYYVNKTDKIPDEWQIPLQRAMAKIPGLSEKLPAYVDAWGREQKQSENIGVRIAENFLSPGYYKKRNVTEVDEMLKQLYADTGESSVLPSNFAKSFKVDGENLNLSGKQYVDAQKKKGQTAYNMLDQLIADKDYKKLSSEQKASIVSDVYSYANVKGKQEVSNYTTDTKWYKNIEEAKSKHGISNADYLIAQNHYSNLDGDDKKIKMLDQLVADKGTSAKQDVALMEYIAGVDMSKYKKATSEPSKQLALYKIKNDANKNNIEQIQKEFKEDVYGAREIYYKSEGDWNYDIDDVIDNGKNRDKKVPVFERFEFSDKEITQGYNAVIGLNKKDDMIDALTDAFGSKKKATTFYNILKGKKGYK